tara:strand:- start:4315 stop:5256 length:942 start_codon:yes stop_codon:yes gene_type:complete
MKIEKNVLIMSLFPNKITKLFDETFNTFKTYEQENAEKFIESLSDKIEAIAVMGGTTVSSELIKKLPKLKIIANYGVGYDAVDVKQATLSNVKVTNTPDVLNDEVADTAIALTLCVYKNIALANQFLLEKKWLISEYPLSKKFSGTKFGILGMGRIGKTIATRIESFNCEICYHSRNQKDVKYKYFSKLEDLAEYVDTLCVITPGGEETKHLVNANVLQKLGKNGFLINIARGTVIDQKALIYALQNNIIRGAGLDVFENEPNVPDDLINLSNVILTPHIGSATVETRYDMGKLVYDNIVQMLTTNTTISPVN